MDNNAQIPNLRSEDQFILACLQQQPNLPYLDLDEEVLRHRMAYHRVTSMVYHYLLKTDRLRDFSPLMQTLLRSHYHYTISRNLTIRHLVSQIASALETSRIDVMVLKGAVFLQSFPGYDLVREMNDLDIMVKAEDINTAVKALAQLGFEDRISFTAPRNRIRNLYLRFADNAVSLHSNCGAYANLMVELHWQLFSPSINYTLWSHQKLWVRAIYCSEQKVYHFDPIDTLLHLCVHQCNNLDIFLYGLVDVSHLLKFWHQINWIEAIDRAKAQGILLHLINILRLCRELLHTPLPEAYDSLLKRYESSAESGYYLLLEWLFEKEVSTGDQAKYLTNLKAFRRLEPFSPFRYLRFLTPYPVRQTVRFLAQRYLLEKL